MKRRILMCIALIFLILTPILADDLEKMCGVWVNPDYEGKGWYYAGKMIIEPDGTWIDYSRITDTTHMFKGTFVINESWHDSEGNIWYKVTTTNIVHPFTNYSLRRVNNSGDILEYVWDRNKHPNEINPNHINYAIYYRQK